jgi:3-isopropylmalate/(R)-2-methylmalate dehydratase small subunit
MSTESSPKRAVRGKVFKFGDSINTDIIYPGRFLPVTDPEEMASHAFQGVSDDFPARLEKNCFVLAGTNFGCGSSREQAVTCLKYAGVAGIIAKGFSRIFFRNCINQGFPVITCADAVDEISDGQIISVDFAGGKIFTEKEEFTFPSLSPFIMDIINSGGLINYTMKVIKT